MSNQICNQITLSDGRRLGYAEFGNRQGKPNALVGFFQQPPFEFDAFQPYRLEMGTRLETERGKNLYAFWGERIAKALDAEVAESGGRAVFNLASKEYSKAVPASGLSVRITFSAPIRILPSRTRSLSSAVRRICSQISW